MLEDSVLESENLHIEDQSLSATKQANASH